MRRSFPEIASFDAKARLPELLREVRAGHRFTITVRGKPVADLVPCPKEGEAGVAEAVDAIRAFPRVKGIDAATVESWIEEGRD